MEKWKEQGREPERGEGWQKARVDRKVTSIRTLEAGEGQREAYLTRASFRRAFCSSSCLSW